MHFASSEKKVNYIFHVRQKSNPLKVFAVFSAIVWNFCMNFLHIYVTILTTLNCQAAFNTFNNL